MRKNSRIIFRSVFRIKVSWRDTDRPLGYVGDLSYNGMRLLLDQPALTAGGRGELRLRTRNKEGRIITADVDIKCMWARENVKTGYIEAGCTLESPSEGFTALVNSLQARRQTD